MPPKGRRVHNTRSASGTCAQSKSPLVVKVNNDLTKPKQPQQAKAKLKSIVKVVKNATNAAAPRKSLSVRVQPLRLIISRSINRLRHNGRLPSQMPWCIGSFPWWLPSTHVHPPQHQVTRITRAHRATMFYFSKVAQWFRRTEAGIIQYRHQYTVNLLWWFLGTLTADLVQDLVTKIALIFHSRDHRAMWARTWALVRPIWRWTMRIIPHPLRRGDPLAILWLLHLYHRGLWN